MENNQNDQVLLLIRQLLETIRDQHITVPDTKTSPFDDIWGEINTDLVNYRKRMEQVLKDKETALQAKIAALERENGELQSAQKQQADAITRLNNEVSETKKANEDLSNAMGKQQEEYTLLMQELENYKRQLAELASLREQVSSLTVENGKLTEELNGFSGSNAQLTETQQALDQQIKELTGMLESNEIELKTLRESSTKLQSKLDAIKEESAASGKIADEYKSMTAKWKTLLGQVIKCSAMKAYCEENGLIDDSKMDTLLHFISLVGDKTGFARTVRNILVPDRNISDPAAITTDTISLIKAVNAFYREKYGDELTGDVLFMPEGFSFDQTTAATGIRFNQGEMQLFRGTSPFVNKVLAPGYKGIDGSIDKAYVL